MKKAIFFVIMMVASMFIAPTIYALDNAVAKVGDVEYTTVQEAINNANGKTVTLLKDVTESVTIAKDSTVTLDLAGYTLTNKEGSHTVTNKGTLTITGNGTLDNVSHGKGALVNNGTATLVNGTLTRSKEAGTDPKTSGGNSWYVLDNNGGTFNMEGGKVLGTSGFSSAIRNLQATFNMKGGEIVNGFIALKNDDNGIINMTGGIITTENETGSAIQNWGQLAMTGGTLNAKSEGSKAIYTLSWDDKYNQVSTVISDNAIINGDVKIDYDRSSNPTKMPEFTVNGGTINGDIEDVVGGKITITAGKVTGEVTGKGEVAIAKADYTKINTLIDKANKLNKDLYTEESLKKLTVAINAVQYDKTILEQDEVNKMAADIESALAALEEVKAANPDTADINIVTLLVIMITGTFGLGYTIKKRFN